MNLPQRIKVQAVIKSRYNSEMFTDFSGLSRPANWDDRKSGLEQVLTSNGEQIALRSGGAQSTPKEGWVLLLTAGSDEEGYEWTLYGITKSPVSSNKS